MRVELTRDYRFEAAHRLPMVPPDHKCARMHGHSFCVEVTVAGEVDAKMGWLVDFADISAVALPVLRHRVLVNFQAEADGIDADEIVRQLLTHVRARG